MSKRVKVKPGKSQSAVTMVVGVIFCLIGLFVAVPSMGMFGFIWTGVAAAITIMHAVNFFSDQGMATHEIEINDEFKSISEPTKTDSVEERLRTVDRLYQNGTITAEEREQKRKQILNEL